MSEAVVAEGVVRVDKSLIMELRVCCGKGVDITLCVRSFSMAYPQRNGTYPRCPRPFEGMRWSNVSGTLQHVIKAIKQLLKKGWPGNRVYWKDIFFSFYTSGHLSPSIPTKLLFTVYKYRLSRGWKGNFAITPRSRFWGAGCQHRLPSRFIGFLYAHFNRHLKMSDKVLPEMVPQQKMILS